MNTSNTLRLATLTLLLASSLCAADSPSIELVSKPANPRPRSFGDSGDLSLSADGKWSVFASSGNGLVTNKTDGVTLNVFLRNNETGEIKLISAHNELGPANGNSYAPTFTSNAGLLVFESEADNLVPNDQNESTDVFAYYSFPPGSDGALVRISLDADSDPLDGASGAPVLSGDGEFLLIETEAGISPLDTNNSVDLYLYRLGPDEIELVTTKSNSLQAASVAFPSSFTGTFDASISTNGRFVAFISSATNHTPGLPANAQPQIYLRDMVSQTNAWLTRVDTGAAAVIVSSPVVSPDGSFVLFLSSDLISPIVLGSQSTYLYRYDIASGTLSQVQLVPSQPVEDFSLAAGGQFVAFSATNQIYLHDLAAGTNILASRTTEGQPSAGVSSDPVISADGRFVAFISTATNLSGGSTNGLFQTYVFDRDSAEVTLLSRSTFAGGDTGANSDTFFPVISADGSTIGFMTYASNLTTNDNPLSNDIFLVSSSGTGAVTLASAPHPHSISATPAGQSYVEAQAISLDGRFVVFSSEAPDVVPNDTNSTRDIFLRDLQSGTTTLLSRQPDGAAHPGQSTFISASLDLNVVLYSVNELSTGGVLTRRLYLYNKFTASNSLAAILPNGSPAANVSQALLSPDGRLLAFRELTAATSPLYLRDLTTGTTTQYIPSPITVGTEPIAISPSGDFLLTRQFSTTYALHDLAQRSYLTNIASPALIAQPFSANGSLLISTGTPLNAQLQLRSLTSTSAPVLIGTNATPLAISLDGSSAAYTERDGTNSYLYFYNVASGTSSPLMMDGTNVPIRIRPGSTFSADGRFFAFISATALTSVDHPFNKLYIYDTVLKTVRLAATSASGQSADSGVGSPTLSANGRVVVYDTFAANLVENDVNFASDVFVSRFLPVDTDSDGLEDGWEAIYFSGLSGSANTDSDGDGISNLDEFRAGTDPNNASSQLSIVIEAEGEILTITGPASLGSSYELEFCNDLTAGDWQSISGPAVAFSNSISFDASISLEGQGFFRIRAIH